MNCFPQIQSVMFVAYPLLSNTLHTFKLSSGCIMLWIWLYGVGDWGVFQGEKECNGAKLRQNPRGKPGSVSAFHQTLGDEFTFQQDNNLKHNAKSTLKLLTKKIVNVLEWQSHSLDWILLENWWQAVACIHGCWGTPGSLQKNDQERNMSNNLPLHIQQEAQCISPEKTSESETAPLCLFMCRPYISYFLVQTSMTLLPLVALNASEANKHLASLD